MFPIFARSAYFFAWQSNQSIVALNELALDPGLSKSQEIASILFT
jgi:hypothetical protein